MRLNVQGKHAVITTVSAGQYRVCISRPGKQDGEAHMMGAKPRKELQGVTRMK